MAKYEAMIVLKGTLEKDIAKKIAQEMQDNLKGAKNLEVKDLDLRTLAYEIDNNKKGYYYQFNFEADGETVAEFRRLALINPNLLRQLVVNLEKDYGYRATTNEKKVKKNKIKIERKAEFDLKRQAEIAANPELAARYERKNRERSSFRGPRREKRED